MLRRHPSSTLFPYTTLFRSNLHRQQVVEVDGQSDIVVMGIPYVGPYNVNSILNPILVHCLGLGRSEEHTSELQSHHDLVCRLLLEKKNKKTTTNTTTHTNQL